MRTLIGAIHTNMKDTPPARVRGIPPRWAVRTLLVVSTLGPAFGCVAPASYRHSADRVAYRAIEQAQREALGRAEPFTLERPEETLRRRLLLDQHLPRSSPVSLGTQELEAIAQWPDAAYLDTDSGDDPTDAWNTEEAIKISLIDALQIAARESRAYQTAKERVFEVALQLDLEADEFRNTWSSTLASLVDWDLNEEIVIDDRGNTDTQTITGVDNSGIIGFRRRLENGLSFTGSIGLDLVSLLTQEKWFSRGVFADVTITMPLMRGAGEFVVREPLTQAERDVVYAIYDFERFKREFAVDVASDYLAVLGRSDSVQNTEENYRSLIASTRRARRLADAGRLPEIQVDQSQQDELRARNQWVAAVATHQRQLDGFKLTLGLPVDSNVELDPKELAVLSDSLSDLIAGPEEGTQSGGTPSADAPVELLNPGHGRAGKYELDPPAAILVALDHRLDLRVAVGNVYDTQRIVAIAADQLRADLTLLGSGSTGAGRTLDSAGLENANLRPDLGRYSAMLTLDLPYERTAERNVYRGSLIRLERAVRDVQELEDQIKLEIKNGLSRLMEARETIQIQASSVFLASRRVASTNLFLEAGRAEIRDLLEAQESLVSAQNSLTAALVSYRVGELALQRDLGVLEVNHQGMWQEYTP